MKESIYVSEIIVLSAHSSLVCWFDPVNDVPA